MTIIVGLGNPDKKYQRTRHNVGQRVIKELAKNKSKDFILAQPQSYMNQSGLTVKKLTSFYKVKSENLWVIHDDIDLPLGSFKISQGQGSAGHKGVQSIINELKTKDFHRIRIGICPQKGKPKAVDKFVLQNFTKDEERIIKGVVDEAIRAIESGLSR